MCIRDRSVSVYAENTEAAAENTEAAAESVEEAAGTGKEDKEKKEENATLGEVKAAGDGSITIAVGTRKEKPGDDSKETTCLLYTSFLREKLLSVFRI